MDRRTPVALLGALTLSVGLLAVAVPAEAAPRPTFKTLRVLPHTDTYRDRLPADTDGGPSGGGGRGTTKLNRTVSDSCISGNPIASPQWYFVGEKTIGALRMSARAWGEATDDIDLATGTAVVDHWTGKVLSCSTAFVQRWKKPVDLVAYLHEPWLGGDWGDWDLLLTVQVDRTSSAPANDRVENAEPITELPFRARVDTSQADGDGPWIVDYTNCQQSAINPEQAGTVWYTYTAETSGPAPAFTASPATSWNDANHLTAMVTGFLEVGADGSTTFPERVNDACDEPALLEAGRTYLLGVGLFWDYHESKLLAGGGLVDVSLTDR